MSNKLRNAILKVCINEPLFEVFVTCSFTTAQAAALMGQTKEDFLTKLSNAWDMIAEEPHGENID